MIRTSTGFGGCNVSKVIVACLLCSLLGDMLDLKRLLCVESVLEQVILGWEFWRLFTHLLVISSSANLFACLVFFFSFRHLERLMGSRGFLTFILKVVLTSPFLMIAAALVLNINPYTVGSGPLGLIAALVALTIHEKLVPEPNLHFLVLGLCYMLPLGLQTLVEASIGYGVCLFWLRNKEIRTWWK
jgi:hypothetical protein